MKNKRKPPMGDPMSYSDVQLAKNVLKAPNKFICIRCLAQAKYEDEIQHHLDCPERKRK